jgi:hypothetical protein
MPTFKELVKQDPRMRNLLIVGAIFLIAPPIFSWFENPDGWIREYLGYLLYGFGLPLLVIAALFFSRWRKLTRLAARGLEVAAIVEKAWSTRDGKMATVRFTLDGREHRVKVQVPSQHWNCDDGASATLLVDPDNPKNVSLLHVTSVFDDLRAKLRSH